MRWNSETENGTVTSVFWKTKTLAKPTKKHLLVALKATTIGAILMHQMRLYAIQQLSQGKVTTTGCT